MSPAYFESLQSLALTRSRSTKKERESVTNPLARGFCDILKITAHCKAYPQSTKWKHTNERETTNYLSECNITCETA